MQMQIKRMNWVQKRPLYKVMKAQRERQQAMTANFESATVAASTNFALAQQNLFAGQASLVTQAAITRTQNELKAKVATLNMQV